MEVDVPTADGASISAEGMEVLGVDDIELETPPRFWIFAAALRVLMRTALTVVDWPYG
jgi:hypothetical protein